jgi:hypothetical protein
MKKVNIIKNDNQKCAKVIKKLAIIKSILYNENM